MTTDQAMRLRLDEAEFGRLLLRIEADVHRGGWDSPPWVFVLMHADTHEDTALRIRRALRGSGPSIRVRGFLAQPLINPRYFTGTRAPAPEALRTFALNLAYAEQETPETVRQMLRQPGVFGFTAVTSTWHSRDPDAARRAIAGEIMVADAPDAVECRRLITVTTDGRAMAVTRERRCKPQLNMDSQEHGDITTSLRILCDMVAGQVPPIEEFEQRYPTLEQLAARQ